MNKFKTISLLTLCILMASCVKEKREAIYNNQESQKDQYISKNMYIKKTVDGIQVDDTLDVVYRAGSSRLITQEGLGEGLSANGAVSFYYAGYTFNGSKSLFATNHQQTAEEQHWNLTDPNYSIMTIDMRDTDIIEGLKNGLIGVKSGEICQILFSGKYAFGKKPVGMIPANSAILFEIWVEAVSNE